MRTDRSAMAVPSACEEAVLLARAGSVAFDDTVAVLTVVPSPLAGVLATKVTVLLAPTARVPTGQVTVLLAPSVQLSGEEAKVKPAGSGSLVTVPVATDGPALEAVSE